MSSFIKLIGVIVTTVSLAGSGVGIWLGIGHIFGELIIATSINPEIPKTKFVNIIIILTLAECVSLVCTSLSIVTVMFS